MIGSRTTAAFPLVFAFALVACQPASAGEAEEKGNVAWLVKRGDRDATFALGRLADRNAAAEKAISAMAPSDALSLTTWQGVVRGAPWADKLVRRELATGNADMLASSMTPADPHLLPFVDDLEKAIVAQNKAAPNVASILASIGPGARASVERRMREAPTRDVMCAAIDTVHASDDARSALLALSPADRDSQACTAAIVRMASTHENVRKWLGQFAEPGLLSVAGKETMPCSPLSETFRIVLAERAADRSLVVPLRHAIERCTREMDLVVSAALAARPLVSGVVASAMDPRGTATADMRATCVWLRDHQAQAVDKGQVATLLTAGCKVALGTR